MKVVKDFKDYLDIIDKLALKLPPEDKNKLSNILSVMLTLLVSLKRDSHLGSIKFPWE